MNQRALFAETIGTFFLVAAIICPMVFAVGAPAGATGIVAVAMSVGVAAVALTCAIGHVSGGHYNPAVTIGLIAAGRFESSKAPGYVIAQCIGAILAVAFIAYGLGGAQVSKTMGANGFDQASMMKSGLVAVILVEIVLTALLVMVVVGATSKRAPSGFAPIAIGFTLAAVHLMAIPVSNTSVNPARSLGSALFGGALAMQQLWVFIAAPIIGGIVGGIVGRGLQDD